MIRYFPLLSPYNNCGPYGPRGSGTHYGVDLCAPTGTPIVAVDDGSVTFGTDAMGGNVAVLHAHDGNAYYHAHLEKFEGSNRTVNAGDIIGYVDMTGNAVNTIPHLHFEWWPTGSFQRPAPDPTTQLVDAPIFGVEPPLPVASPSSSRSYAGTIAIAFGIVAASGVIAWAMRRPRPLRRRRAAV
jgi:murein DD-endopeptidase MepM/ murein hydrolase activator NlpD